MPMIVSPRSRYSRSYATSDGTVRVQLPQVNTQKLSNTTWPRSSDSRSGRSALSQLVLVSSGAGIPPTLGTADRSAAVVPATAPASTVPSKGFASHRLGERGGPEIHAEPPAPDRNRTVLGQIQACRHVVVLVPNVAFQRA